MKKMVFGIAITTTLSLAGFFGGKISNVSGEGFLRTKGGSIITCAGNQVYIEKDNNKGYAFLTDFLIIQEQKLGILKYLNTSERLKRSNNLKYLESKHIDKVGYWEKRLQDSPSAASKSFINEQIIKEKDRETSSDRKAIEENLKKIKALKEENVKAELEGSKEVHALQKEISEIKEKHSKSIKADTKETTCNSQGQFSFVGLTPDTYYISTTVEWFVGDKKQGGIVSKTVILKEGENQIFITK